MATQYYDPSTGVDKVFHTGAFTTNPSTTEVWSFIAKLANNDPLPTGVSIINTGTGLEFTVSPSTPPGNYNINVEAFLSTGESNRDLFFILSVVDIVLPPAQPSSVKTWVNDPKAPKQIFVDGFETNPPNYADTWTYTHSVSPAIVGTNPFNVV